MSNYNITLSVNYTSEVKIDYGIFNGNNIIVFIKVGLMGSIYGYKNKYLRIAENLNKKFGCTIFCVSNPIGANNSIYHGMKMIENYCIARKFYDYKVYFLGHSNGAMQGLYECSKFKKIEKCLFINPVLNELPKKIVQSFRSLFDKKVFVICGSKDPCFYLFKLYSELENECENLKFVAYINADHNFTGCMEEFINLPEKYLFHN